MYVMPIYIPYMCQTSITKKYFRKLVEIILKRTSRVLITNFYFQKCSQFLKFS